MTDFVRSVTPISFDPIFLRNLFMTADHFLAILLSIAFVALLLGYVYAAATVLSGEITETVISFIIPGWVVLAVSALCLCVANGFADVDLRLTGAVIVGGTCAWIFSNIMLFLLVTTKSVSYR